MNRLKTRIFHAPRASPAGSAGFQPVSNLLYRRLPVGRSFQLAGRLAGWKPALQLWRFECWAVFRLIPLFLMVLFLPWPVSAADFYVASNGNDSNPGTQPKPFATLERARDAI